MATESRRGRGRPAKALDPNASLRAALGAKLRELRNQRELTLTQLAKLTGYSCQHLGAIEQNAVAPSESAIASCDAALSAGGALTSMFPAVIREQAHVRHRNTASRREPIVDWERLHACTGRTSTVTPAVANDIEAITTHQRRLYHELTSAQMLQPVDGRDTVIGLIMGFGGGACGETITARIDVQRDFILATTGGARSPEEQPSVGSNPVPRLLSDTVTADVDLQSSDP